MTSNKAKKLKKVMFVLNIPAPYRAFFFSTLDFVLRQKGINLFVVYCAKSEPDRDWDFISNKNSYRHVILREQPYVIGGHPIHLNASIWKLINEECPDTIIIGGSWHMPTGWIAHLAGKRIGAQLLFWSESHAMAVRNPSGFIPVIRRLAYKQYERFCAPNRLSADWINRVRNKSSDIVALPNLVDEAVFVSSGLQEGKESRPNSQYALKLVQVSKLEDHKGVLPLVEAVIGLNREMPGSVHLTLVGNGIQYALVAEMIVQCSDPAAIALLGACKQAQVAEALRNADVFILNTRFDPNPISVIEALFCGKPIIVTEVCGNAHEVVHVGENGYIIPNAEEIGPAIRNLLRQYLEDPLAIKTMGRRSLEIAASRFSALSASEDLLRQLQSTGDLT